MPASAPEGWPTDTTVMQPTVEVTVDGLTGQADRVSVTREIATDLPDQVRGISGMSSASATIEWTADDPVTGPGHWQPFRGRAVKRSDVRRVVTIDAGLDGVTVPLFRGKAVASSGSTDDGALWLDCADDVIDLARPADLPALAYRMPVPDSASTITCGITPSWAMHRVLANAGFHSVPSPRPGCMLNVPLQGSLYPALGVLTAGAADTEFPGTYWTERTHRAPDGTETQVAGSRHVGWAGGAAQIAVWSMGAEAAGTQVRVALHYSGAGTVSVTLYGDVGTADPAETLIEIDESTIEVSRPGSTLVSVSWPGRGPVEITMTSAFTSSGTTKAHARWDGGTQSWTGASQSVGIPQSARLSPSSGSVAAGFQVGTTTTTASTPWGYVDFEPTADLDECMGTIDATPGVYTPPGGKKSERPSVWGVLQDIAVAELGVCWRAEDGTPTFRNRSSLRGVGVTAVPLTAADSLEGYAWEENIQATYGWVEVPYSPVIIRESVAAVADVDVWELKQPMVLQANARVTSSAWAILTGVPIGLDTAMKSDHYAATVGSGYRAVSRADGVSRTMQVTAEQTSPLGVRITAKTFPLTGSIYDMLDPDGDPWMVLRARMSIEQPDDTSGEAVAIARADTSTEDVFTLESSPWRQHNVASTALARWLASELRSPRPVLRDVRIVPDLLLRLGDIVQIDHPDTELGVRGVVVAVSPAFADGGLVDMTIDVRALPAVYAELKEVWAGDTYDDLKAEWSGDDYADMRDDPLRRS